METNKPTRLSYIQFGIILFLGLLLQSAAMAANVAIGQVRIPQTISLSLPPTEATSLLIDATGEKVSFCGPLYAPGWASGTKDIARVQIKFGAVTKAGGSALTISLQDPSTSTSTLRPDETQDQTVAVANADSAFASGAFYRSGTLSANRTVARGGMVCGVVEYDGSGRLGSDSVVIAGLTSLVTSSEIQNSGAELKTASWANAAVVPNIIFEMTDGTLATFPGAFVYSAIGSLQYNNGTGTADEYAMEWSLGAPVTIDAIGFLGYGADNSAPQGILYDGTSVVQSAVDADDDSVTSQSAARYFTFFLPSNQALTASHTYRIAFKPNNTGNINTYYFDVNDAAHMALHGGTQFVLTSRLDSGSWASATATRGLFAYVRVVGIDDGSGSGSTTYVTIPGGFVIR